MPGRKARRPLSAMSEDERARWRKELTQLASKAREENRRKGLLLSNREGDRLLRLLRGE